MHADLPIGIFDSGLGGLTIVKALYDLLPDEQVIYFGDTAHLPYGDKSPELINGFAGNITRFLLSQKVKAIIIACNTASAVSLDTVKELSGILPIFDVVSPAARAAVEVSSSKRIGIIGTKTTINSHVYARTLWDLEPSARVVEKATPLLVPMIEEGWLHSTLSNEVIEAYMSDTGFFQIDSLILGCTHYPLIKDTIGQYFDNNFHHKVHVLDSAYAVVREVKAFLEKEGHLRHLPNPKHRFFASDFSQNFEDSAKLFLNQPVSFQKADPHSTHTAG